MLKIRGYILSAFVLAILAACEKPEDLWELPPAGSETITSVNLGPTYDNTIFVELKTGKAEVRNVHSWHIAFANGANQYQITVNGGTEVQVLPTGDTAFGKTYTVGTSTNWIWDNPSGNLDSTAFGNWLDTATGVSKREVYLVDLGSKVKDRYKKCIVLSLENDTYTLLYANLDGTAQRTLSVPKQSGSNFTYINLETGKTVAYEPTGFVWDMVFTKYRHVYYDMEPITPYYVTGVLINRGKVLVAQTNEYSFESIDLAKATKIALSVKADEIGYDWKFFDLNGTGKYTVDSKKIYIIKDDEGYLYKLHFIDFYDETGAKGFPKYAYQRL